MDVREDVTWRGVMDVREDAKEKAWSVGTMLEGQPSPWLRPWGNAVARGTVRASQCRRRGADAGALTSDGARSRRQGIGWPPAVQIVRFLIGAERA
jgi:hypothetical protein